MSVAISTKLGTFSKERFNALLNVRSAALAAFRNTLTREGYTEVSTSSLVNIAGSCENPYASFRLNYYGREAHLSQSAQLQLEALVIRLKRGVFTINSSFREENYNDPEAQGRRLSEFTLIEAEKPYLDSSPDKTLNTIIDTEEKIIKDVTYEVLRSCRRDIRRLSGDVKFLESTISKPLPRITYNESLQFLNAKSGHYSFGDDLGVREERIILAHFENTPTFITHYPAAIKFFNMKRSPDGKQVYSVDLLTPRLGETSGGAVREEEGEKIRQYLLNSKISTFLRERGGDPLNQFNDYLDLFEQEQPVLRGGFGIGFERFVGFLLNSNDILETIAYQTMQPSAD